MRHLYKIFFICGLLIITKAGYPLTLRNTPQGSGQPTFTINEGASIVLHGASTFAAAYQWFRDGVRIPGAINKDYTATLAGTYTVVAFNTESCPSAISDGVIVIVNPPVVGPPVVVSPPPVTTPPTSPTKQDTAVDLMITIQSTNPKAQPGDNYNYILTANNNSTIAGTQVQVSYVLPPQLIYVPAPNSSGAVSYNPATRILTWNISQLVENQPKNLTITVKVLQPGVILSSVDIKGKQLDPILANNVAQTIQQVNPLIVPNVFTPNGDGINDTFFIPGLDTYSENEITIINRWGNDVYEKKNYKNDWTGNGLVEGTYFYILRAKTLAGVWDVYKGYVTLIRSRRAE
jgi:gliding motility-associated-like protein/uncharacterized repeat protein (TIGR01451 family)